MLVIEQIPPPKPTIQWDAAAGIFISSASAGNQWYRNDTLIVGATNPTHMPVKSGLFTVTVEDSVDCISEKSDPLGFYLSETAVSSFGAPVYLYPNPIEQTLFVQTNEHPLRSIRIFNTSGMLLIDINSDLSTQRVKAIDLTALAAGTYFVEVGLSNAHRQRTVIVKH